MTRKILPWLAVFLCLWAAGCESGDRKTAEITTPAERVSVSATAFSAPNGDITILWRFTLADAWHLYAPLRNDSGFPPRVALSLPDGWSVGPLQWPAPQRHLAAGDILDHVYYDELLVVQDLNPPPGAKPGQNFVIPARLDWLICKDSCVPGRTQIDLEVTIGSNLAAAGRGEDLLRAVAAVAGPAPRSGIEYVWSEHAVEIVVPDALALEFYPADDCAELVDVINDAIGDSDRLLLKLRAKGGEFGPLKGVLRQKLTGDRSRTWEISQPFGG